MRATDFMHAGGIRMVEDHVGKPQDLYLWCSVGGQELGSLGLPDAVYDRLSLRNPHYRVRALSLSLQFYGHHNAKNYVSNLLEVVAH